MMNRSVFPSHNITLEHLIVFIIVSYMLGNELDTLKSIFHLRAETLRHRVGKGESIVWQTSKVGSSAIGWKYLTELSNETNIGNPFNKNSAYIWYNHPAHSFRQSHKWLSPGWILEILRTLASFRTQGSPAHRSLVAGIQP